ncbi:hypothetical protein KXD40_003926 [Peronospora effusa]|uniref:Cwf18 pre-mRNA splicing factor n=1 Tax=Peronospora effusa TaxID=542832 RepID=A0A3M6VVA9_9STRA|nr:hypothetical protein DD238_000198 [Peronospora effusa]UIZ22891.1 hypothetical protein KXD40_003926 [Peronospora effusa]CAI5703097.1 unnamed protein product [Peronospora effusa]
MAGADEAIPRAKRLKLLRKAKARKERGEVENDAAVDPDASALDVVDASIEVEAEKPNDQQDTDMTDEKTKDLVERVDQAQEENAKTEDESEDELLNLAPKRANWDMERDIAPMLRKLERRTQHAIVEILREKLAAEQQEEDSDNDEEHEEEAEEVDA